MKVLISGAFPDSTTQTSGQNPLFIGVANALAAMGHDIHCFDAGRFTESPSFAQKQFERSITVPIRLLGLPKRVVKHWLPWSVTYQQEHALLRTVQAVRPQALLVMSYVRYRPQTLQACRALGVEQLIGWCLEGPLHEYKPQHEWNHYDRYFCIHRHIPAHASKHIRWLPALCLDTNNFHRLPDVKPLAKVVFVGAKTARRVKFLKAISHMPLEIWGPGGWPKEPSLTHAFQGEYIWGKQLNRLYNESAIVLNTSSWDPSLSGLPQRVVDIPAAGAFLLTDESDELQDLFDVGREVDTFSTPENLAEKCAYYLTHDKARQTMADAGWRKAQAIQSIHMIAGQLLDAAN